MQDDGQLLAPNRVAMLATLLAANDIAIAQDRIENIDVWAQKTSAPRQDLPATLSALTAEDLAEAGLDSLDDVTNRIPALTIHRSTSATTTSLRIRRVGNLGNIPTFEPAVGLFTDGAFRARAHFGTFEFVDIQRLEVLQGPQHSIYGKSASAGVVALYSMPPSGQLEVSGEATFGWLDTTTDATTSLYKLRVSGPISREIGASISAAHRAHDHTFDNALEGGPDGNNEDRTYIRAQVQWKPTDAWDLRIITAYGREHSDQGESDVIFAPEAGTTRILSELQRNGLTPRCPDNEPRNYVSCAAHTNKLALEVSEITALASYRFESGWSVESMTGWDWYRALRTDDDTTQMFTPILFYRDSEEGQSVQQEIRLRSRGSENIEWLAGAYYYRHDYERGLDGSRPMFGASGPLAYHPLWRDVLGGIPFALPGQDGLHESDLDTRYFALFGSARFALAERLAVNMTMRWAQEDKDARINNSVSIPGASFVANVMTPTTAPDGSPVNGHRSRRMRDVSWSVTPQFDLQDGLTTYLTVARGAKSGGFNTGFGNAPLNDREFGDEHVRHAEVGAKAMLMSDRLRLTAAAFRTRYRDYQDASFVGGRFTVGNAERVALDGFEIEGEALIGDSIAVDFAISRADLVYETHTTGMCYPGRTPDGSLPRSCDLSGERPLQAPESIANLGFTHTLDTSWGELYTRLQWSWTDRYNTSFSADPRLQQDAHSDVAVRIGAQFGRSEVVAWGTNLLDERVVDLDAVLNLFNDASYQSYMQLPRSFGLTLRTAF
jgi:iron complex outermembrane recepter protein